MNKFLSSLTLGAMLLCGSLPLSGQYTSVDFDYEKATFNNGQPLPAETYFELRGDIPENVGMVEVAIYRPHQFPERPALYRATWKRHFNNPSERFQLPINYNLRSNETYDLSIAYFRKATRQEVAAIRSEMSEALYSYLDQNLEFDRKRIRLSKKGKSMISDMNDMVKRGLRHYRSGLDRGWEGFSDLIEEQINRVSKSRQNRFLGKKSSQEENLAQKEKLVDELKTLVQKELNHLLEAQLYVQVDHKLAENYRTEGKQRQFTLHGGYGGAYFHTGNVDEAFGRSFMAGITIPLAREPFASPFWSRTSLMAGVFFEDFTLNDDLRATGPLLGRPYYAGVGYRFYRFLRLSSGVTLLEDRARANSQVNPSNQIYVQPFVALTIDINLMISLAP